MTNETYSTCILLDSLRNSTKYITVASLLDHWRDLDTDGRIILRWIFRKWEGVVGTGWSWLRIGTGGGHL